MTHRAPQPAIREGDRYRNSQCLWTHDEGDDVGVLYDETNMEAYVAADPDHWVDRREMR